MEEIDIIELLKRVKEGKAPKEIEIKGCKYKYNTLDEDYDYIRVGIDDGIYDLVDDYNIFDMLDTKIKILDKPIIEECDEIDLQAFKDDEYVKAVIRTNRKKINEIIKFINEKN